MEEHVYRALYELEDRHWWFRGRRAVIKAMLRRAGVTSVARALDVGCGAGRNLLEYAHLGEVLGVDPSSDAVAFCRRRGLEGVSQSSIEGLPFEDESFDLLCATDVLEHVDDDRVALEELRRVGLPGGHLLVTVPAYMWLWSDSDVALHHRRRYTRPELVQAAQDAGWQVVLTTYFNSLLLAPIAVARRLRRDRAAARAELAATPPSLDGLLSLPMRLEALLIDRGLFLPAGVSIGFVFRRM